MSPRFGWMTSKSCTSLPWRQSSPPTSISIQKNDIYMDGERSSYPPHDCSSHIGNSSTALVSDFSSPSLNSSRKQLVFASDYARYGLAFASKDNLS